MFLRFNKLNIISFKKIDMIRFFYDATGLANHIDVGAIYKVFLKKTYLYKIKLRKIQK